MKTLIIFYFKTLSFISPKAAANSAFNIFQKVRKKSIRDREKAFYEKANKSVIEFDSEPIDSYAFGNPDHDIVILLHGWDSNAGCMLKFVDKLLEKDKYVLSINLPAHAFYRADKTNLFVCKSAFKTFLNTLPSNKNVSIIAHSFGSAISGYALSELKIKIDQLVFLTSPNHIKDVFEEFKQMISLGNKAYKLLLHKADMVLGEPLEEVNTQDKLKLANFDHLHLFHDEFDKVISYRNSEDIHESIENSSLYKYQNIGHYRMLWNDELVEKVIGII